MVSRGWGRDRRPLTQKKWERVWVFTTAAASIHAHVPANVRGKVWAGEYVEMSSLLPGFRSSKPNLTLGVQQQGAMVHPRCVRPKAKPEIRNFPQWVKAFHIFMSLYLSQPIHFPEGPALLKYVDTIICPCLSPVYCMEMVNGVGMAGKTANQIEKKWLDHKSHMLTAIQK